MKTKVLIVNSVNDFITERRIERLISNPLTANFEIFHSYALRDLNEKATLNEMTFRIELGIKSFQPEYVIFHTGASFHNQPDIYQKCVINLKQKYDNIKFGYEPRLSNECVNYFDNLEIFDKDKKTSEIIRVLFFNVFNRPIDDKLWISQQ